MPYTLVFKKSSALEFMPILEYHKGRGFEAYVNIDTLVSQLQQQDTTMLDTIDHLYMCNWIIDSFQSSWRSNSVPKVFAEAEPLLLALEPLLDKGSWFQLTELIYATVLNPDLWRSAWSNTTDINKARFILKGVLNAVLESEASPLLLNDYKHTDLLMAGLATITFSVRPEIHSLIQHFRDCWVPSSILDLDPSLLDAAPNQYNTRVLSLVPQLDSRSKAIRDFLSLLSHIDYYVGVQHNWEGSFPLSERDLQP